MENRIMAFAHLTLATRDVRRSADFFARTMRWPEVPAPANAPVEVAWVQVGPRQQLHILRVADFAPSPFEAEFGRHYAVFHDEADFPDLKRRLVGHGAELIDPVRPTPFARFFFRDPNGYVFEVVSREGYVAE